MYGKSVKINHWLIPVSWLYGLGVEIRNKLFDWGILPAEEFDIPVISVGNLAVGGTGKTPHIEYLIELLGHKYHIAVLSRGYKRKSRGFILACLLYTSDAAEHRYVTPLSSIVLTDYNRALHLDKLLPAGRLRESRHELSRANMVIVTKCPIDMKPIEYNIISRWLHLFPYQNLYFSTLSYGHLQAVFPDTAIGEISLKDISKKDGLMVVTGIANPAPMLQYISHFHDLREKLLYPDHHNFTSNDLNDITTRFLALKGEKKYIITTEKDAARLRSVPFDDAIKKALYFLPIHVRFMQHTGTSFDEKISDIIYKNRRSKQVKK